MRDYEAQLRVPHGLDILAPLRLEPAACRFPGGHGKTGSTEDHERIMDGLEEKVFGRLPDETWVYPGHGDDTTLGAERPHLQEWRDRGW